MKKLIFSLFLTFILGFVFVKNINATTIITTDTGVAINEDYIYNRFVEVGNLLGRPFDATIYSYIGCTLFNKTANSIDCYAFNKNDIAKGGIFTYENTGNYPHVDIIIKPHSSAYQFRVNYKTNELTRYIYLWTEFDISNSASVFALGHYNTNSTKTNSYTNFSKIDDSGYTFANNLDFGEYTVGELTMKSMELQKLSVRP